MSISRLAVSRPIGTAALAVGVSIAGVVAMLRLPVNLMPDIAVPRLTIRADYVGAAPTEVEASIAIPVEQAAASVPGVRRVASVSREGGAVVTLDFDWGTDMDFASLNVRERMDATRSLLPISSPRPVVLRSDPGALPIASIDVSGRGTESVAELTPLVRDVFAKRFEQLDGIAQAEVVGGTGSYVRVEVDPIRLRSFGLTVEDIAASIKGANVAAPVGLIRRGLTAYTLRIVGDIAAADELSAVPIRLPQNELGSSSTIRLRDVAKFYVLPTEQLSIARVDGVHAIRLLLYQESGGNAMEISRQVRVAAADLSREYPRLVVAPNTRQGRFVQLVLQNLMQEILIGGALAVLALLVFLRSPAASIAIACVIPTSVLGTFVVLDLLGQSLNIMSAGGLALAIALLMDNAIVIVENTATQQALGFGKAEAAIRGARQMSLPLLASTLTTVVVFLPITFIGGIAAELFRPLSITVAAALLVSLVISLTVLPALCSRIDLGSSPRSEDSNNHRLGKGSRWMRLYEDTVRWCLCHRAPVLLGSLTAVVLAVVGAGHLERSVLPVVEESAFRVELRGPRGTALEVTDSVSRDIEQYLRAQGEVLSTSILLGSRNSTATELSAPTGSNTALLDVQTASPAARVRVLSSLEKFAATSEGFQISRLPAEASLLGGLFDFGRAPIAVHVSAKNFEVASLAASELASTMRGDSALRNVRLATSSRQEEMQVRIDPLRAANGGIHPSDVASQIINSLQGASAGEIGPSNSKLSVLVQSPGSSVDKLDRFVSGELLPAAAGGIALAIAEGPGEIFRQQQARVATVLADVGGAGLNAALKSAQKSATLVARRGGLAAMLSGESQEIRDTLSAVLLVTLVSLGLAFLILTAEFESFLYPVIVLLSVPLALIGSLAALALTGQGLNVMSLVGIVIMIGIVDNDAVVKVDCIIRMRAEGLSVEDAVVAAGHSRLRPILMNSATALFGLIPMAFGFGVGADFQRPLAIAVFGGLLVGTLLTLFVIPTAFAVLSDLLGENPHRDAERRVASGRILESQESDGDSK